MQTVRVAIVGAGLSGLHAASLLEQQGIHDYVLLEARGVFGGRIASLSAPGADDSDRFDLGPTWFWPEFQPQLDGLVRELGLQRFRQHEDGDIVVERALAEPVQRLRGFVNAPASMRLVGGMESLVDALRRRVDAARVLAGQRVRAMRRIADAVELECEDAAGGTSSWRAAHVLLALPPRLAAQTITFTPALPAVLAHEWAETATWMAPHAKYLAIYDTPFWREQGLSGAGRSARGPLVEIHDASMPGGSAGLFGFFGVPAQGRRNIPEDVLKTHCRAQLARMFGPQAALPRLDAVKDWALDPCTAVAADAGSAGEHAQAPAAAPSSGAWAGHLTGIASEWSRQFPGYLAGAIEAADLGVDRLSRLLERTT